MVFLLFQSIFSPTGNSPEINPRPFCPSDPVQVTFLEPLLSPGWSLKNKLASLYLYPYSHAATRISLPSLGQPSSGGIVSISLCQGRVKQNSRICCLLTSQNSSFCLQKKKINAISWAPCPVPDKRMQMEQKFKQCFPQISLMDAV